MNPIKLAKLAFKSLASFVSGWAMNSIAVLSNHGLMPVWLGGYSDHVWVLDGRHQAMMASHHFKILCDIIAIPQWGMIASFGDVLLVCGVTGGFIVFAIGLATYLTERFLPRL